MKDIAKYVLAEAAKSNVEKRKVGCIIVDAKGDIVTRGYNTEDTHAEIRALEHLQGILWQKPATAYVSHAPCPACAEAIYKYGITNIEVVEEFLKFDGDKLRPDLIPASSMIALAEVLTFGARKYKPNNWRECKDLSRYRAAMLRHIIAYQAGEKNDEESGMPHLWHAFTNIAFLIELEE